MIMAEIRVIITGGTIDKEYIPNTGVMGFGSSHISQMLSQARTSLNIVVQELMLMDSLNLTVSDRARIAEACNASPEKCIVIVHGTDTMIDTGECLDQIKRKCIVLTGAIIPWTCANSDSSFNLGTALAFVQALPCGTYIAMNGRISLWDMVVKNRETGIFESVI